METLQTNTWFSNIPVKWRKELAKIEMIEFIIEKLLKSSNQVRSL
jgi:hypothetical protein